MLCEPFRAGKISGSQNHKKIILYNNIQKKHVLKQLTFMLSVDAGNASSPFYVSINWPGIDRSSLSGVSGQAKRL